MLTRRKPDAEVAPQQQYAVVLVNEDQLEHLLNRPAMRNVGPRTIQSRTLLARYSPMQRRTAAVGALVLIAAASAVAWLWTPRPAVASMFAWKESGAPTLATGASFSVAVSSMQSASGASSAANRIRNQGLPAFTRNVRDGQLHQVLVGPYASLDEAEGMQRRLRTLGLGSGSLFVDEALRHAPRNDARAEVPAGSPNLVLVAAPDRLSLVLELPLEPRQVGTRRPTDRTLDVEVGPMPVTVRPQQWSAPAGVDLLDEVAIEEFIDPDSGRYLRARLTLPEFVRPSVRAEGRRIYVDLTWPDINAQGPASLNDAASHGRTYADMGRGRAESGESAPAPSRGTAREEEAYRQALQPSIARLEEIAPFVLRAAEAPSPEVLGALEQTLAALDASLTSMQVPRRAAAEHEQLVNAVRSARRAMSPGFEGDRLAQAHHALGLYRHGNAAVTVTTPAVQ